MRAGGSRAATGMAGRLAPGLAPAPVEASPRGQNNALVVLSSRFPSPARTTRPPAAPLPLLPPRAAPRALAPAALDAPAMASTRRRPLFMCPARQRTGPCHREPHTAGFPRWCRAKCRRRPVATRPRAARTGEGPNAAGRGRAGAKKQPSQRRPRPTPAAYGHHRSRAATGIAGRLARRVPRQAWRVGWRRAWRSIRARSRSGLARQPRPLP